MFTLGDHWGTFAAIEAATGESGFVSYFMPLSHQCSVLKRVSEGTMRINRAHE